jgi:MGT family glycosyltransferase
MVAEFFAGVDLRAALPALLEIIDDFRPDVIVRESWEFASTIAAELRGVPLTRVGLGLASLEEGTVQLAAGAVDEARRGAGLAGDPAGDKLREAFYFTLMPEPMEDTSERIAPTIHRFRTDSVGATAPLPDWWGGSDDPLVYLTLGSVAAGAHLPYFPALYRAAAQALASLPIRVLVTIGEDRDPAELEPNPANVHVERWVAQEAVLPHADAIVCHGGYGSMLGALSHGVPLVVLPLFSGDQWANAAAVGRAGAGVALDAEQTRPVLEPPGPETVDELPRAVRRVLEEEAFGATAGRMAESIRALPTAESTVEVLATISG